MRKLFLLALLVLPIYGQQLVVADWGLVGTNPDSGPACPTPVWQMDLSAGASAYSGSDGSGTLTLTGTTKVEDPVSSGIYALDMDGANDDWRGGTGIDNLAAGAGFSVEAWVRIDIDQQGIITGKHSLGASTFGWRILQNGTTDAFTLSISEENVANQDIFRSPLDSVDAFVGLTTYVHIMAKVSSCTGMGCTGAQWYINGSPVTTTQVTDVSGTLDDDSTFTMMGGTDGASNSDFNGRISGVRVYNSAVSDACAAARFAAGRS